MVMWQVLDETWDALLSNVKSALTMVVKKVMQRNVGQEAQYHSPLVKSDSSQGFLEPVS